MRIRKVALTALLGLAACKSQPDKNLFAQFDRHRSDYEKIQRSLCALGNYELITRTGVRWWGLRKPEKRFFSQDYVSSRGIMGIIVLPVGYKGRTVCTVFIDVSSNDPLGLQPRWVKMFRHGPPENVPLQNKPSLDNLSNDDRRGAYQRRIVDDWWLEAQNWR